ncbi:putative membrane protein [Pacificibacter maritimus]|uniref:Putative membrane protein n=1 Tax=Pacificibacter maritimus TaxID=762213 RepID=A0A3N4UQ43_9RHOB|nr:TIGR01620 family protein [Pacificibacter maritimus]RPE67117.1 putative membrane protein [Pacificibacter maritimus]
MTDTPPRKPSRGPVRIDLDDAPATVTPSTAEPVPDLTPLRAPSAMERAAVFAARKPSVLARWFWRLLLTLVTFAVTLVSYDFVAALIARNPILGYSALALVLAFCAVLLTIALKELAGFARLKRIDTLQKAAIDAAAAQDLNAARVVTEKLQTVYKSRNDVSWGNDRFNERKGEVFDADGLLKLAETEFLIPLDTAARREVEAAARQVAMVTALVPIALADVFTALTANLRMIRRIAEIYGGRSGTLGSWRVTRSVLTHLVATGAVAVGDDLIGSLAGGGVLAKVSRRFGEGVVNGALTARVGVAAIEVCRPLPFSAAKKPSVTGTVQRALTGLFG